jgi:hypothetical protein
MLETLAHQLEADARGTAGHDGELASGFSGHIGLL